MTKEKLIDNLRWSMENQAIDLRWVQENVLRELGNNIDLMCLECKSGSKEPQPLNLGAIM